MTGQKHSMDAREKISTALNGNQYAKGFKHSEETRMKGYLSRLGNTHAKGMHHTDATRKHLSELRKGRGNANWRGGISFEPYCPAFNSKLKEEVRNSFGRTCFVCGCKEGRHKHDVHHCDYNKSQGCSGKSWGLIPLCKSCHTKTNYHRWHWFALLRDYWIYGYIDFNSNLF